MLCSSAVAFEFKILFTCLQTFHVSTEKRLSNINKKNPRGNFESPSRFDNATNPWEDLL